MNEAPTSIRRGRRVVPDRVRRTIGDVIRWTVQRGSDWAAADQGSRLADQFGRFGPGTIVTFPHGAIYGHRYIHLGADTLIAPHVTLSVGMVPDQTMESDPVIKIGDGCLIGRGTSIVGHFEIDIGDNVFTGMNVYITDQNHGYTTLDEPIGRQEPSEVPVRIGSGTWIGSGAVILPGSTIGRQVVVAANAVVRGDVPDHCVVAGVPAKIVRRHDDDDGWQRVASGP